MSHVFLDNHSTTPTDPAVVESMLPYFREQYGNPGSINHSFGTTAKAAVERSREEIAQILCVDPNEIVFTSGATESNNLAIRGFADRLSELSIHVVSMSTEHKAVLDPLRRLAKQGHQITLLPPVLGPDEQAGQLDLDALQEHLTDKTQFVSVMLVNNEIGNIQPIQELADICHRRGIVVHCDATQAIGRIPVDVARLDVDMLSFSGHKMYGPPGIGGLVVRRRRPRIRLAPLIEGGGQENGLRSGTLNVPGIVGLATAFRLCENHFETESNHIGALRDRLWQDLKTEVPGIHLNGPSFLHRIPGNLNIHVEGVDGEALMMNMGDVAVSSGSACTSANPEPSHVLRAIGLSDDATRSSLRFGIGRFNTEDDIALAVNAVRNAVHHLRSLA